MDNEIKTWLYDILQSINEIDGYYTDLPKRFDTYKNDTKTKRAIERNIEIIGEAVYRIRKKDADFKIPNSEQIIGTRNIIAHGYDKVSDEIMWSIVVNHLPKLKEAIEKMLGE